MKYTLYHQVLLKSI